MTNNKSIGSHALKKQHRLFSKIQIDFLFKHAKHITEYPIRLSYCAITPSNRLWFDKSGQENKPVLCMFTASKRIYKRANKRNRCKRLMKEAYRLKRQNMEANASSKNLKLFLALNYIGREISSFKEVETSVSKLVQKCLEQISHE